MLLTEMTSSLKKKYSKIDYHIATGNFVLKKANGNLFTICDE